MMRQSGIVPNILLTPHAFKEAREADVIRIYRDHDDCQKLAAHPGIPTDYVPTQRTKIIFYSGQDIPYEQAHPDTPYIPVRNLRDTHVKRTISKHTITTQQDRRGWQVYGILSNKDTWNNTTSLGWAIIDEVLRKAVSSEVEQQNSFVRILRSIGSRALPIQSPEEVAYAKYPVNFNDIADFLPYKVEYRTDPTHTAH